MRFLSMLILAFVPLLSTEALAKSIFDKKINGVEYICEKRDSSEFCFLKKDPYWFLLARKRDAQLLINCGEPKDGLCLIMQSYFGEKKHSLVSMYEVQCKTNKVSHVLTLIYDKPMMEGKIINKFEKDRSWISPKPRTPLYDALTIECRE